MFSPRCPLPSSSACLRIWRHVYFPTTSIVLLLYVLADGASVEIAVVGNEGILGISLPMGGDTTPS